MIKNTKKKNIPTNKCNNCGIYKSHSSSNMSYLCGKCYLQAKHEERLKKGLT